MTMFPGGLEPSRVALDERSIGTVLERFYGEVRRDAELGPIFAGAIADEDWPEHMARIRAFWLSVLFRRGGYKGNPFGVHARLPGLTPALFGRWLGLFGESCRAILIAEDAAALGERAARIADSLQAGLFFRPETASG